MVLETIHQSEVELLLVPQLDQIELVMAHIVTLDQMHDVLSVIFRFHLARLIDETSLGHQFGVFWGLVRTLQRVFNLPLETSVFGVLRILINDSSVHHIDVLHHVHGRLVRRLSVNIIPVALSASVHVVKAAAQFHQPIVCALVAAYHFVDVRLEG